MWQGPPTVSCGISRQLDLWLLHSCVHTHEPAPSLPRLSLQQFVRMLISIETAALCRGAGGPHSPRPTPGETLVREPPLLRQSQVRSERAHARAAAVFARVGSLQCRKGQGAPRVPGSDGRTAQRARRRPPSATRPRRRFPRARFGGGAARCAPIGSRAA